MMQYYPYIVSHSIQQSLAQFIDNNYVKNQFKGATGFDDFSKRLKESFDKAEDLAKMREIILKPSKNSEKTYRIVLFWPWEE
ncbi:MAG: hypothetical protein HWD59_02580 [Coxiellaceae bacterium]|nr:MAG: hypothetical protein HWD59_02580 [Coxiellaceae bacterium]